MKLLLVYLLLFVALLATWTACDWHFLRTPPEERGSNDWVFYFLAIYPLIAAVVTARYKERQSLLWRTTTGVLVFVGYAAFSFAAIMTIGLEIHFWLGGSL